MPFNYLNSFTQLKFCVHVHVLDMSYQMVLFESCFGGGYPLMLSNLAKSHKGALTLTLYLFILCVLLTLFFIFYHTK